MTDVTQAANPASVARPHRGAQALEARPAEQPPARSLGGRQLVQPGDQRSELALHDRQPGGHRVQFGGRPRRRVPGSRSRGSRSRASRAAPGPTCPRRLPASRRCGGRGRRGTGCRMGGDHRARQASPVPHGIAVGLCPRTDVGGPRSSHVISLSGPSATGPPRERAPARAGCDRAARVLQEICRSGRKTPALTLVRAAIMVRPVPLRPATGRYDQKPAHSTRSSHVNP